MQVLSIKNPCLKPVLKPEKFGEFLYKMLGG